MHAVFFILSILFTLASASLQHVSGPDASLQSFGEAEATQTFLLSVTPEESITRLQIIPDKTMRPILTHVDTSSNEVSPGMHNISAHLTFDAYPGIITYTLIVTTSVIGSPTPMTYSLKRTHNVFGIVVYEEHTDAILSGDQGAGFKFDSYVSALKASTLRVLSHVPEGTHLSPEVQIREMMGSEDAKFLSATGVKLSGDLLVLTPNKYRVGRGGVFVNLAFPGFEMGGEILETSLQVAVGISSTPPPVVSDADVFADISVDGSAVFQVNMFNAQNWKEMKATVGATVFTADREISAMGEVDQKITFRASSASEGVYKMKLSVVDEAGKQVNAILLHDTKVTMRAELGDAASAGSGNVDGKAVDVVAIVVGCVVGLLVVVGLAGALVAVWSRRQSEDDSESFAPSMGSEAFGGVDIARDVYGRGSVSFMEREEARFDGV